MAGRIGAKVGLLSWFRPGLIVSNLVRVSVRCTGLPQCKIANSQSWYLENKPFLKMYRGFANSALSFIYIHDRAALSPVSTRDKVMT